LIHYFALALHQVIINIFLFYLETMSCSEAYA